MAGPASSALAAAARPRLLCVEPDTAACVLRSLADGALVSVPTDVTAMNGLNCGTPSSIAWPYLRGGLDAAIAVTDDDARAAVAGLTSAGIAAGPSGAAGLGRPGRPGRPAGGADRPQRGGAAT